MKLKRWVLSRRDSAELVAKIESSLKVDLKLPKSAQAACAEPEEGVVFVGFDGLEFVQTKDSFIPFPVSYTHLTLPTICSV